MCGKSDWQDMPNMENLILSVEERPCLWDSTIEDYQDREKKDLAWLQIYKNLIPNWDTLSTEDKKNKSLEVKRKWSNCRDYYKKDKQKLKNTPTGSAAKKGKRYVYSDILGFLDKVIKRRNHEGNYDEDDDNELHRNSENEETVDDDREEQRDTRNQRALEDATIDNIRKNSDKETKPKKKKTQDVPGEILNIIKNKKATTDNKEYDDDEKYLLSFSGDMKKMTHIQKIDFKLGMLQLLKNIFKEREASPNYINSPSSGSSYTPVYHDYSRSSSAQSLYPNMQTVTTTRRSQPQGIVILPGSENYTALLDPSASASSNLQTVITASRLTQPQEINSQNSTTLNQTDPSARVIINSVETISNSGVQQNDLAQYLTFK